MILNNPGMLNELDESVLCTMANKLNPYAKVVDSKSKPVLFSFTNFQEDRLCAQKTLSLYMFMKQLINEHDNWSDELKN